MLDGWIVTLSALGYILLLFAIASFGDRRSRLPLAVKSRPFIYALSLSVYCTSWTFYGSVGGATRDGLEFLAIYTGPILLFAFGFPLLRRIIRVAKTERITSIADFMAARYGKSQTVGATATVIAVIGIIPYIALQLKALSLSVTTMIGPFGPPDGVSLLTSFGDITLLIAVGMAVFAWLFGTRHIDATEHQEGLMLAIALEAVVKLFTFLAVGFWVTYALYDGPLDLVAAIATSPKIASVFSQPFQPAEWIAITCLSLIASLLLPRQFHVVVTENNSEAELRLATWMFPLYLIAINLFVVPIAAAGMLTLDPGINPDSYVLALPMASGQGFLALLAFIGGLSAATAMIIVATVALAIMISNDIVVPLILRQRGSDDIASTRGKDLSRMLLRVRRASIFAILLLAYAYYRAAGDTAALSSIGLLSFAAIAQFAPAFFGGLFWRKATARGAIAGMVAGFALWLYTLLLPTFVQSGLIAEAILFDGPFGIEWLRPQSLFYSPADPFLHGVAFSLLANLTCFILFSLTRAPEPSERLQANLFVPPELASTPSFRLWRTHVTVGDLKATVARYLGVERSERSFARYARERGLTLDLNAPADAQVLRYSEQLLASAIGAASARLVLSLLLKRRDATIKGAMKLLDDASEAIQYNRDLLQTALDQVRQGIAVFDRDLRLICWNRQFRDLLGLPPEYGQVGTPLDTIIRFNAERGELRGSSADAIVADRIDKLVIRQETFQERLSITGTILEVRISPMPDGGIVTTFTDITERVLSEEALSRSHETLERRVRERTEELTRVNQQLVQATHAAEEANIGKTRFLAAAGHDILQPLNAARLYASVLVDRFREGEAGDLVRNVEASLESVEDIIGAILDISRLDTGALKPEYSTFRLDEILRALLLEFEPVAHERNLRLNFIPTSLTVRSDRRLLRRLLQNLVSNALKYTLTGRVLVGCRRHGSRVVIEVHDTGIGIPASKQKAIFMEFHRLDDGIRTAKGLGLGLCIVERISRVLDHPVTLRSKMGKGSCFAVEVPSAAPVPVLPSPGEPVAVTTSQLDGMLVLTIDNEPNILDGMRRLLESWGCEVLTASNDVEAAQHVTQLGRMPDIMLVDYHLDQGNGIECAVRLRWKFGRSIPALLVTADRSRAVRTEAAERDIGLLNKPVRPAALRAQLARARAEMLVTE